MKSIISLTPANRQEMNPVSENAPKNPIKVALVDDDDNELALMTRAVDQSPDLERVGSYSSGLEALKGIPPSASEVVLMDVRMPGMSGIETTRRLKDVRPSLFVIMISGCDDLHTAARAREAGANAFLTKPLSLGQFFDALLCLPRRNLPPRLKRTRRGFWSNRVTETPQTASTTSLPRSGAVQDRTRSVEQEQGELIEVAAVRNELFRIVISLEENFHARQDLLQEALVYLWSKTHQYPGRALTWYLRGARFHLQNLRKSGRSLDSSKRRTARASIPDRCDEWDNWRDSLEFDEGFLSDVAARELFSLLAARLMPIDRKIFVGLREGMEVPGLAEDLHVSQMFVIRHRRRIAELAATLDTSPGPANSLSHGC